MTFDPSDPRGPLDGAGPSPSEPHWVTRRDTSPQPYEHPPASLFAHPAVRHAHKHFRRVFIAVGSLIALLGLALFLLALSLRHDMRTSLPPLDGALRVPGLAQPVTVTRDPKGVPSITAAGIDDVLFAQGFVTAQDRLWQMDMLRRHASGNLAELLGPNMVQHDRLQRTLMLRQAAANAVARLPADQLHQLQAYARGVNAFITQATDPHNEHLPVEFHLLHYRPAAWQPRDTVLVYLAMVEDLSTGFPVKLRREAFARHLSPQLLNDLYPVGSWRDRPPMQPPPDLTTPVPEVEQIPLDRSQSMLAVPHDILQLAHQFLTPCAGCRAGSNNWAVSGVHTATGMPLLSNDMHLSLSVPDIWYEAALHAPATDTTAALDVTGFTLPGVPFIIVGRNRHVAWGFTNLGGDVQDVRIEHTRGSGKDLEYQQPDGSWSPVTHHTEHIVVRGGRDITLDVATTTETFAPSTMSAAAPGVTAMETPIITPLLPSEHRTLSLAWTIYDPGVIRTPFLAADQAADGPSLVNALATFNAPSLNLVYADDHNHIGFHALGAIPIRGVAIQHPRALAPIPATSSATSDEENQSDEEDNETQNETATQEMHPLPAPAETLSYTIGSPISPTPVDALDASQIWSGYIPFAQLPSVTDPANGLLATANSRITPDAYPYAITLNWASPYRAERIYKLLTNRNALTPADMLAVQTDVHSEFDLLVSQRLAYAVDHASKSTLARDSKQLQQAANILRAWNGDLTINAVAPSIVEATRAELLPMLLLPQIAAHDKRAGISSRPADVLALYDWAGQTVALEELLQHTPTRWLPPGFANWDDLLATALLRALHNAHAPSTLANWHYGPQHPISIDHPLFGTLSLFNHLLGTPTGTGPHPTGGDTTTIRAIGPHFGPSERFTADLANPQSTFANITTGESGNPLSPFYLDQFLPWLNGATFTLPLQSTQPTHTLTLLP